MHFDSPGGGVCGVQELADLVYQSRAVKPITAVCDSMCCSAALWVATQAGRFYITPGGMTGSLGVYLMHVDESQALADQGVKVTFVRAPAAKAEGNPYEPLTGEALAHFQAGVDRTYDRFLRAVARGRGVTPAYAAANFGQGRTLDATEARAARLVDGVKTFADAHASMLAGTPVPGPYATEDEVRRADEVLELRAAQAGRQAEADALERELRAERAGRLSEVEKLRAEHRRRKAEAAAIERAVWRQGRRP